MTRRDLGTVRSLRPHTALHLLFPFLRGWCPTCRPIPGVPFHKSACLWASQETWL